MRNVQAAAARRPEHPRRGNRGRPSRAWPCGHGPTSGAGFYQEAGSGRPSLPGPRRPLGHEGPSSRPCRPPLSLEASPLPPEMPGVLETDPGWAGKSGDRRRAFGAGRTALPQIWRRRLSARRMQALSRSYFYSRAFLPRPPPLFFPLLFSYLCFLIE